MAKTAVDVLKIAKTWPIFPCSPLDKKPLTTNGFYDATTDEKTIREWWRRWPNAMVGVPTGSVSGFWVLDLDLDDSKGKDGIQEWKKISKSHELVLTRVHRTPRGGEHMLFRYDPERPVGSSTDRVGRGIDTRGDGGYVVIPPSRNSEGREYTSNGKEILEAPDWLLELVVRPQRDHRDSREHAPVDLATLTAAVAELPNDDDRWTELDLRDYVGWDGWNRIAMAIFASTGGSKEGLELFHSWSKKSGKYNRQATDEKWSALRGCPPDEIGPGTIIFLADRVNKDWRSRHQQQAVHASLLTERQFRDRYVPPDYLLDGILQRGYVYCMTGNTGSGKTCVALMLAMLVLLGRALAGRDVAKGRVLYFAGENPQDVQCRWERLREVMQVPDNVELDIHFMWGAHPIGVPQVRRQIDHYVQTTGPVDLVVVDTSAAYSSVKDENDNVQMLAHAKMLRSFVDLPGNPVVLATTHPMKHYDPDNLLPRGGGAFLNEMDGNLTLVHDHLQMTSELGCGKWRGPEFGVIPFKLVSGPSGTLKDKKGRPLLTVHAHVMSSEDLERVEGASESKENNLLLLCARSPGMTEVEYARRLEWKMSNGDPNKVLVSRVFKRLQRDKLVVHQRGRWTLTKQGERETKDMAESPTKKQNGPQQSDLPY